MSSISRKLSMYGAATPEAAPAVPDQKSERDRQRGPSVTSPDGGPSPALLIGESRLTERAPGFYTYREFHDFAEYGTKDIEMYLPLRLTGILELALLDWKEAVHPEEVLFLDTETTGLSRGAGTLPFLTGLAFFRGRTLQVVQLFLEDQRGEGAYLDYLMEYFARFSCIASYNGKAFDIPLIKNRLILNRKRGGPPALHFDLLHILKRLFPARSLPGYKQKDLEGELLGATRDDDIPGAEIPQIYFDYKKYGEDRGLTRVLHHNRLDMLGMVFLFLEAVRIYDKRDASSEALRSGLARVLARNHRRREAIHMLESRENEALNDEEFPLLYRDRLFLAGLYRQQRDWNDALRVYEMTAERYDCQYARMSAARILEHRLREFTPAREHTIALIEGNAASAKEAEGGVRLYSNDELEYRLARLERKLEKAASGGARP